MEWPDSGFKERFFLMMNEARLDLKTISSLLGKKSNVAWEWWVRGAWPPYPELMAACEILGAKSPEHFAWLFFGLGEKPILDVQMRVASQPLQSSESVQVHASKKGKSAPGPTFVALKNNAKPESAPRPKPAPIFVRLPDADPPKKPKWKAVENPASQIAPHRKKS